MILDAPKERIAGYVAERTGHVFSGGYAALAYERDGEIRGAAIFDIWRGTDIELTVAGDEFPRAFLQACAKYVFGGLKCQRATLRTRADHRAAIGAAIRVGARIEGMQRDFYRDCDAVLFGITPGDFAYGNL